MRTYTEKIHGARLLKMMKKKNPCLCCPATPYFKDNLPSETMWRNSYILGEHPCDICKEFVGLDNQYTDCPCNELGKKAIKRTWIALEEKGYLE